MIAISLFGHTTVEVDGAVPPPRLSGKPRQILGILALEAGAPLPKERLADLLWDGCPPAGYVGTLESYVCVLRRALGLGPGRGAVLATTPDGYALRPGPDVAVDYVRFRDLARRATEATGATAAGLANEAVDLLQGELLADVPYADWAVRAREVCERLVEELCTHGAQHANASGDHATAARLARLVVDRGVTREEAWHQLMLAWWLSGQRGRALDVYAALRELMLDQVGEEPGAETYELYLAVLRDSSERARLQGAERVELKALLRLLRQALDCTPGLRAPARDAQLSAVAVRALEPMG